MSKITDVFKQLSHGSIGAVQNGCQLSDLAQYLNVNRMIEENIKSHMQAIKANGGGLVLLIGNAGDGKSHIISKLRLAVCIMTSNSTMMLQLVARQECLPSKP